MLVKQPWIQTYEGIQFTMLEPRVEDINILDIAHALSQEPRFGGHAKRHYSVAQHCVNLSKFAGSEKLRRLLHDAPEAYLKDIPRPYKYAPGVKEVLRPIEARMEVAVAARFGLELPLVDAAVKRDDDILLATEAWHLMRPDHFDEWEPSPHLYRADDEVCADLGLDFTYWPDELAELRYLQQFIRLTEGT